jgi:hypothetical protein
MIKYKVVIFILTIYSFLTGCFLSHEQAFENEDIIVDDRIVGEYEAYRDGKKFEGKWIIEKSLGNRSNYSLSLKDKDSFQALTGTLFEINGVKFLNLEPRSNGAYRKGNEAGPTQSELLFYATHERYHVIWKVEIEETKLSCSIISPKGIGKLQSLLRPDYLKGREVGQFSFLRLPEDKERAREILILAAKTDQVFDFKFTLKEIENL